MELRLTYQETNSLIEKKAGRALPISYSSAHSIRISYDVNVLFKSTSVGMDLNVERVSNCGIILSFDGGSGIDFMVRQVLNKAKKRPGGEYIELLDGNRILLDLGRGQQAGSLLDQIELRDIRFDERYIIVEFTPKNIAC